MTGPRQRRDERILALVARVGLQGRHAELLGHFRAGVDHDGFDRAGGQGTGADRIPILATAVGGLPDVDGDRDHLDALVLDQPTHRHRRIEASAIGQYHSLRHGQSLPVPVVEIRSWRDAGHVTQTRRHHLPPQLLVYHDEDRVVPGHRPDDRVQPASIERRAYDMGRSRRRAQHDQVARVRHLDHPLPQHPPQVVLWGDLVHRQFREGVRRIATGQPDFHRAQVFEIARHRRLCRLDALLGQQRHQLPLAGHRLRLEELGDPVLTLVLRQSTPLDRLGHDSSTAQAKIPRIAVCRCAACRQTTLCEPSRTEAEISSPRCAGRQCSTATSGSATVEQRVVDDVAQRTRRGGSPISSSCPMLVHTSV